MRYKSPSRINFVSVIVLLALAAAVYAGVRFVPIYYRSFKVQESINEAAFSFRRRGDDGLREKLIAKIRAQGVADPNLSVQLQKANGRVKVSAHYSEYVDHPIIKKRTTLQFAPETELEE